MRHMPVLETPRLILRPFTREDGPAMYPLMTIPAVIRYVGNTPAASVEDAYRVLEEGALRDYQVHGYGRHAIVWKASGAVIGFHGLKFVDEIGETEIGYRLLPEYWRQGLATEAGRVVLTHAWSAVGVTRVVAMIHPENEASKGVARKLGLSFERRFTLSFVKDSEMELYDVARPND